MIAGLLLIVAVWAAPAPVLAEPLVARLNHAGFRIRHHCTASLVGDGHVVTAAHCIPQSATEIVLLFGYDLEIYDRILRGNATGFRGVPGQDIAIWCHADPETPGFNLSSEPPSTPLRLIGYGLPARHLRQTTTCPLQSFNDTRIGVGCQVTQGTSGAPALGGSEAAPIYYGVVSASGPSGTRVERLTMQQLDGFCAES